MSTEVPGRELGAALFGKTRRSVLALFYRHAGESFYLRQTARLTGAGLGAVQRELQNLTAAGILRRRVQGREVYYQANPDCPIFAELERLMLKSAGLRDLLISALAPLGARVSLAFVFGSLARRGARPESDIDLLVVGEVGFGELVSALGPVQEQLQREINPVLYPGAEFSCKAAGAGQFLHRVLAGPKMFVMGDEDELARLAQPRLDQRPSDRPGRNRRTARRGRAGPG